MRLYCCANFCMLISTLLLLYSVYCCTAGLGTRQFNGFATTTTRQRIRPEIKSKNIYVSMSRWCIHTKYRNIAITNNFVACKQGPVVATVLSRAELCCTVTLWLSFDMRAAIIWCYHSQSLILIC